MTSPSPQRPRPTRSALPVVALVPLRSPGIGKTRLAGALTVEQRAALAGAMLADVLTALTAAPVDRVVVAASGPAAAAAASALGAEVLVDPAHVGATSPRHRLDVALAAATAQLGPVGVLLTVAADLPQLTSDEVATLLAADAEVVVAPTADRGTGVLLRRPPDAIATSYGPRSADRHLDAAHRAGRSVLEVTLPGASYDVDAAVDLDRLRRGGAIALGQRTSAVVAALIDAATG